MRYDHVLQAVDEELAHGSSGDVHEGRTFYHGSWYPLPVGKTLKAERKPRYLGRMSETILEDARPDGATPRYQAWYMVDHPCDVMRMAGGTSHIYEVVPRAPVTAANFDWVQSIMRVRTDDGYPMGLTELRRSPEVREYARRYWANEPSGPSPHTEWLTSAVEIIREVKCSDEDQARRYAEHAARAGSAR